MLNSLGRAVLLVRDYDEALTFYRDTLGFRLLHDGPAPDGDRYLHIGLESGHGLWLMRARTEEDEGLVGRQAGGHPFLVVYTNDCRGTTERLRERGVEIRREPYEAAGAAVTHFADLYGNEIVMVEMPGP